MMNKIAWGLLVIGGLNWGLVGLGNLLNKGDWDVVEIVFSDVIGLPVLSDIIYLIVGIAAIVSLIKCLNKRG